jgi:hypothetical protein
MWVVIAAVLMAVPVLGYAAGALVSGGRSGLAAPVTMALGQLLVGTGTSTNPVAQWLNHLLTANSPPAPSSCGTGASIIGSDLAGLITMGTGTPAGCVATFSTPYNSVPLCTVTWQATPLASQSYAVSATAITLTQTGTSSNKVNYTCVAQQGG